MAWSTPLTAVANAALTSAQWNASVRDNLLMTAPALATTASQYFVATGANALAARTPAQGTIATAEGTTSTTYADVTTPGPAVTVTTGNMALVFVSSRLSNSVATAQSFASWALSGATTLAADDRWAVEFQPETANRTHRSTSALLVVGLTAGSNTFTAKYRVSAGTGSFQYRNITVLPY